jgi:mannose-6-phosphate isomerase-like protein (cupin superfamily)
MSNRMTVIRIDEQPTVSFGPLSHYQPLVGDDAASPPVRTGIQTAKPGYAAKLHYHPYVEILHILEGTCEAWIKGEEGEKVALKPGDTLVIPAHTWHSFRVTGQREMRLLGTHMSPQRIVYYEDGTTSVMGKAP